VNTATTAPVNLLEIVEIIGEAAALKLVERYAGQRIRIPALSNATEEHALAQCIGLDALHRLIGLDGGRWMYVARCARGLRDQRDREIVTLYSPPHNVSVNELAQRYNLSYRRIEQILGSTVVDDRQVSLF
jgi:Mor family transcriptional regulator